MIKSLQDLLVAHGVDPNDARAFEENQLAQGLPPIPYADESAVLRAMEAIEANEAARNTWLELTASDKRAQPKNIFSLSDWISQADERRRQRHVDTVSEMVSQLMSGGRTIKFHKASFDLGNVDNLLAKDAKGELVHAAWEVAVIDLKKVDKPVRSIESLKDLWRGELHRVNADLRQTAPEAMVETALLLARRAHVLQHLKQVDHLQESFAIIKRASRELNKLTAQSEPSDAEGAFRYYCEIKDELTVLRAAIRVLYCDPLFPCMGLKSFQSTLARFSPFERLSARSFEIYQQLAGIIADEVEERASVSAMILFSEPSTSSLDSFQLRPVPKTDYFFSLVNWIQSSFTELRHDMKDDVANRVLFRRIVQRLVSEKAKAWKTDSAHEQELQSHIQFMNVPLRERYFDRELDRPTLTRKLFHLFREIPGYQPLPGLKDKIHHRHLVLSKPRTPLPRIMFVK